MAQRRHSSGFVEPCLPSKVTSVSPLAGGDGVLLLLSMLDALNGLVEAGRVERLEHHGDQPEHADGQDQPVLPSSMTGPQMAFLKMALGGGGLGA